MSYCNSFLKYPTCETQQSHTIRHQNLGQIQHKLGGQIHIALRLVNGDLDPACAEVEHLEMPCVDGGGGWRVGAGEATVQVHQVAGVTARTMNFACKKSIRFKTWGSLCMSFFLGQWTIFRLWNHL